MTGQAAIRVALAASDTSGQVLLTCRDGFTIQGPVQAVTADYVIVAGYGFALPTVADMEAL